MSQRVEDQVRVPPGATGLYRAMLVKSGKHRCLWQKSPRRPLRQNQKFDQLEISIRPSACSSSALALTAVKVKCFMNPPGSVLSLSFPHRNTLQHICVYLRDYFTASFKSCNSFEIFPLSLLQFTGFFCLSKQTHRPLCIL